MLAIDVAVVAARAVGAGTVAVVVWTLAGVALGAAGSLGRVEEYAIR